MGAFLLGFTTSAIHSVTHTVFLAFSGVYKCVVLDYDEMTF